MQRTIPTIPEKSTIYISGPMTGVEDLNRAAFKEVENELRAEKHFPLNPHNAAEGLKYWEYMAKDIHQILVESDAVVVLDGWEHSKGAIIEIFLAQQAKVPVYLWKTKEEFKTIFNISRS